MGELDWQLGRDELNWCWKPSISHLLQNMYKLQRWIGCLFIGSGQSFNPLSTLSISPIALCMILSKSEISSISAISAMIQLQICCHHMPSQRLSIGVSDSHTWCSWFEICEYLHLHIMICYSWHICHTFSALNCPPDKLVDLHTAGGASHWIW